MMDQIKLKLMLLAVICTFAGAAVAQEKLPAGSATQTPSTYGTNVTSGVDKWGTLPSGGTTMSTGDGFSVFQGEQFNSKWNMVDGNHDLTTYSVAGKVTSWSGGAVSRSRICSFCHTVHDNEYEFPDRTFLWAHEAGTVLAPSYSSPTLQSTPNTTDTSVTAKCLGCHDGTVAVSSGNYGTPDPAAVPARELSIGNGVDPAVQITLNGKIDPATSQVLIVPLSRTHPVSFTYDATLAAKHQMRIPAAAGSVDGYGLIPLFGAAGDQMECATCHDPHLKTGIMRRAFPTGASQDKGTGSFCLYCHL